MQYVYLDPNGNEEEFRDPCEKMRENLEKEGWQHIGWKKTKGSELISVERAHRARLTQSQAFDNMIESKLWSVDERAQLKDWGVI